MKTALIVVDIQNDFLPGGALAVPDGDATISVANALMPRFDLVVATQDWHPLHHGSFASNNEGARVGELGELDGLPQVMWPNHCVQSTAGASFASALEVEQFDAVFRKGTNPKVDSYSGFFDNGKRGDTGLHAYLSKRGIKEVSVLGLATDYCVKFTAINAKELGFDVTLIERGCRGVELNPGDVAAAIEEMRAAGIAVS